MGHLIEPFIAPLGYDWKIGIGIISSFAAREVFVGTMSVIYSIEGEEDIPALRDAMLAERNQDGGAGRQPVSTIVNIGDFEGPRRQVDGRWVSESVKTSG